MEYKAEDICHSTNISHHVHILVRWHGSITQTRLIFPHLHGSQSPQRGSALPIVANKLKQLSGVSVLASWTPTSDLAKSHWIKNRTLSPQSSLHTAIFVSTKCLLWELTVLLNISEVNEEHPGGTGKSVVLARWCHCPWPHSGGTQWVPTYNFEEHQVELLSKKRSASSAATTSDFWSQSVLTGFPHNHTKQISL